MKCILHGLLVKKRCSCWSKDRCERDESKELSLLEEESASAVRRGQDSRVVLPRISDLMRLVWQASAGQKRGREF
jgi:hypothetical protein